jgi:organic radical activating enzyme
MKRYAIAETFPSVQGEGSMVGTYCAFVRFAGCDLSCWFCDTNHHEREKLTADQLCARIGRYPVGKKDCRWVVLTGGEPLLQVDRMLLDVLHAAGWHVAVETNGHALPGEGVLVAINLLTISPKSPGQFRISDALVRTGLSHTKSLDIKVVLAADGPWSDEALGELRVGSSQYVQPVFEEGKPNPASLERCLAFIRKRPWWKLSVQTHKFLGLR